MIKKIPDYNERYRCTTGSHYKYAYIKDDKVLLSLHVEFDCGTNYIDNFQCNTNDENIIKEFSHTIFNETDYKSLSFPTEIEKHKESFTRDINYKPLSSEKGYDGIYLSGYTLEELSPKYMGTIIGNIEFFVVDCEAIGISPYSGRLTEFGAVHCPTWDSFHGILVNEGKELETFENFDKWIKKHTTKRAIFVSDNPAFDWQWINYNFDKYLGYNPFGHSARRIGDFYAGLLNDFTQTQRWKKLRITKHDHNPVHDAFGNAEALERLFKGER